MNQSGIIFYPYKEGETAFLIPKTKKIYPTCELGLPVPPVEYWLGYGSHGIDEYLSDGKFDVEQMMSIVKESNFSLVEGNRMLELGCGAGRMLRWFQPYSESCEIWGTDINSELIYWSNQYLNPPFNFTTTTTIPHLPFSDSYFNFIYCGSVFTHIDDLGISWLLELRRILAENGLLYITIHDFNTSKELDLNPLYKDHWIKKYMNENELYCFKSN